MSVLEMTEVGSILVLLGAALALRWATTIESVRRLTMAATTVAALGVLVGLADGGVGVQGLARLVTAAVVLATVVSSPRSALTARLAAALLVTEAGMLGAVAADGLASFFGFWLLSLLPGFFVLPSSNGGSGASRLRSTYLQFVVGSTVPLAAALALFALASASGGIDGVGEAATEVASYWRGIAFVLLAFSVLMRMAVAPLHGWLPVLMEEGPLGLAIVLSGVPLGVYAFVQIGLPMVGDIWPSFHHVFGVLGLVSGLYGAIVALPQKDLRRLFAYLRVSQAGLLLAGVAAGNPEGVTGALLYAGALGLTMSGVLLIVWAIQARTGSTALHAFAGSVTDTPSMAASFLVLGFASMGFPGTLSFIAEDLLLHGILGEFAPGAILFLLCTAINAITVMRVFQRTFLGQASRERWHRPRHRVADLVARERGVAFALCLSAVVAGFFPGPLLALAEPTARTIAGLCFG